jgi:uncharacterized membrane protein
VSEQPVVNIPSVNIVPMGNGALWVKQGFRLFKAYPIMWAILTVIYFAILIPLSSIPFLGPIVGSLIAPVFAAGMMFGCRAIDQHGELEINHLFAGFKKNTSQLISLGGMYMLAVLMVMMLVFSNVDQSMIESISTSGEVTPEQMAAFSTPLLMAMLLLVPVLMAYWFAPTLVALNDLSAWEAIKLSFKASLKNTMPFLMYGLVFTAIFMGLMTLVSVAGPLGFMVIFLALGVIVPLMMTTLYTSYRDIFKVA